MWLQEPSRGQRPNVPSCVRNFPGGTSPTSAAQSEPNEGPPVSRKLKENISMNRRTHAVLRTVLLAAVAVSSGCAAQLATASSGEIGCPREEIAISNQTTGWNTSSWTAECRGRAYYCSGIAGSISCREQQDALAVPTAGDELASTDPLAASTTKESCEADCEDGTLCVTSCAATTPAASKGVSRSSRRAQRRAPARRSDASARRD